MISQLRKQPNMQNFIACTILHTPHIQLPSKQRQAVVYSILFSRDKRRSSAEHWMVFKQTCMYACERVVR
jgi:hypothetical protein